MTMTEACPTCTSTTGLWIGDTHHCAGCDPRASAIDDRRLEIVTSQPGELHHVDVYDVDTAEILVTGSGFSLSDARSTARRLFADLYTCQRCSETHIDLPPQSIKACCCRFSDTCKHPARPFICGSCATDRLER